jgi:hypothetical protein
MTTYQSELRFANQLWGKISQTTAVALLALLKTHQLSVCRGDLILLDGRLYVTNAGLLSVAHRNRCAGIEVEPMDEFCDRITKRWMFRATVYTSKTCKGFAGYGDADPTNVSPVVRGAEMRVAETRAVNRALRKAYGIGICSVEEIGSLSEWVETSQQQKKKPVSGV